MSAVIYSDCIIAIVRPKVCNPHVACSDVKTVSVEWEAFPLVGHSVDDRIRDIDVFPANFDVPCDRLARLEALDTATLNIKAHQVRASCDAGSVRRVGIPPLLSIRVDPAVIRIFAARVTNIGAFEVEPIDGRRAREDEFTSSLDILRKVEVAVDMYGHILQVVRGDGCEHVVIHAFEQSDMCDY